MDTKKLSIIVNALKAGSMRAAADEMNYSQSNISYAIKSVEDELGVEIVNKTKRGITLTAEGEMLYDHILTILKDEELLKRKAEQVVSGRSGKIVIGTYPAYAYVWMPSAIKEYYRNQAEHANIKVLQGVTGELIDWLEKDHIEFVVGEKMLLPDELESIPLRRLRMCAAIPKSYKHPEWDQVRLKELSNYPVLFSTLNDVRDNVLQYIDDEVTKENRTEVFANEGFALMKMVEKEIGVAFLSEIYRDICPANVDMIPLDPPLYRDVSIIYKRDNKRIKNKEQSFFRYLQKYAQLLPL